MPTSTSSRRTRSAEAIVRAAADERPMRLRPPRRGTRTRARHRQAVPDPFASTLGPPRRRRRTVREHACTLLSRPPCPRSPRRPARALPPRRRARHVGRGRGRSWVEQQPCPRRRPHPDLTRDATSAARAPLPSARPTASAPPTISFSRRHLPPRPPVGFWSREVRERGVIWGRCVWPTCVLYGEHYLYQKMNNLCTRPTKTPGPMVG
jgi:hypothetical protein